MYRLGLTDQEVFSRQSKSIHIYMYTRQPQLCAERCLLKVHTKYSKGSKGTIFRGRPICSMPLLTEESFTRKTGEEIYIC